jgi:uncharacterized protein YlzI (FlbEa/FlbD family)
MRFIEVTMKNGNRVLINPIYIEAIEEDVENCSLFISKRAQPCFIKENYNAIKDKLEIMD